MFFVYLTTSSLEEAEKISLDLLERKLVACVNVGASVASFFQWNGEVSKQEEVPVILKTTEGCLQEVEARVRALHSYECPCIAAWRVERVNKDFLKWVETSTKLHY